MEAQTNLNHSKWRFRNWWHCFASAKKSHRKSMVLLYSTHHKGFWPLMQSSPSELHVTSLPEYTIVLFLGCLGFPRLVNTALGATKCRNETPGATFRNDWLEKKKQVGVYLSSPASSTLEYSSKCIEAQKRELELENPALHYLSSVANTKVGCDPAVHANALTGADQAFGSGRAFVAKDPSHANDEGTTDIVGKHYVVPPKGMMRTVNDTIASPHESMSFPSKHNDATKQPPEPQQQDENLSINCGVTLPTLSLTGSGPASTLDFATNSSTTEDVAQSLPPTTESRAEASPLHGQSRSGAGHDILTRQRRGATQQQLRKAPSVQTSPGNIVVSKPVVPTPTPLHTNINYVTVPGVASSATCREPEATPLCSENDRGIESARASSSPNKKQVNGEITSSNTLSQRVCESTTTPPSAETKPNLVVVVMDQPIEAACTASTPSVSPSLASTTTSFTGTIKTQKNRDAKRERKKLLQRAKRNKNSRRERMIVTQTPASANAPVDDLVLQFQNLSVREDSNES